MPPGVKLPQFFDKIKNNEVIFEFSFSQFTYM